MAAEHLDVKPSRVTALVKAGRLPQPREHGIYGVEGWPVTVLDCFGAERAGRKSSLALEMFPAGSGSARVVDSRVVGFDPFVPSAVRDPWTQFPQLWVHVQRLETAQGRTVMLVEPLSRLERPWIEVASGPVRRANEDPGWDPQAQGMESRLIGMLMDVAKAMTWGEVFDVSWVMVGSSPLRQDGQFWYELLPVEDAQGSERPFRVSVGPLAAQTVMERLGRVSVLPVPLRIVGLVLGLWPDGYGSGSGVAVDVDGWAQRSALAARLRAGDFDRLAAVVADPLFDRAAGSAGHSRGMTQQEEQRWLPEGAAAALSLDVVRAPVPEGLTRLPMDAGRVIGQDNRSLVWGQLVVLRRRLFEAQTRGLSEARTQQEREQVWEQVEVLSAGLKSGCVALQTVSGGRVDAPVPSDVFYLRQGSVETLPEEVRAVAPHERWSMESEHTLIEEAFEADRGRELHWIRVNGVGRRGEAGYLGRWTRKGLHPGPERFALPVAGMTYADPEDFRDWEDILIHSRCGQGPAWVRVGGALRPMPLHAAPSMSTGPAAPGCQEAVQAVERFLTWLYGASVTDLHRQILTACIEEAPGEDGFTRIHRTALPGLVPDTSTDRMI